MGAPEPTRTVGDATAHGVRVSRRRSATIDGVRLESADITRDGQTKHKVIVRRAASVRVASVRRDGRIGQTLQIALGDGEDPADTLRGELGLGASSVQYFGRFALAPGVSDDVRHLALARDCAPELVAPHQGPLNVSDALTLTLAGLQVAREHPLPARASEALAHPNALAGNLRRVVGGEVILAARPVVHILPVDVHGRIALVRQYRWALDAETVEAPAGGIDPGEGPEDAVRHELAEETGLRAGRLVRLASFPTDPEVMDEHACFYAALDVEPDPQHTARRERSIDLDLRAPETTSLASLRNAAGLIDLKTALLLALARADQLIG